MQNKTEKRTKYFDQFIFSLSVIFPHRALSFIKIHMSGMNALHFKKWFLNLVGCSSNSVEDKRFTNILSFYCTEQTWSTKCEKMGKLV